MEYAAAARLPAASETHAGILEREMRSRRCRQDRDTCRQRLQHHPRRAGGDAPALEEALQLGDDTTLLILCTDSRAALAMFTTGAGAQKTALGPDIWCLLLVASTGGRRLRLQWVPAHCGRTGNERADELAKEASRLPQADMPVDVRSITKAVSRAASKAWRERWPDSLLRRIMGGRLLTSFLSNGREDAVNVHQLRVGHWGLTRSYLHRIGRHPTRDCQQCADMAGQAALCQVCRGGGHTGARHAEVPLPGG